MSAVPQPSLRVRAGAGRRAGGRGGRGGGGGGTGERCEQGSCVLGSSVVSLTSRFIFLSLQFGIRRNRLAAREVTERGEYLAASTRARRARRGIVNFVDTEKGTDHEEKGAASQEYVLFENSMSVGPASIPVRSITIVCAV